RVCGATTQKGHDQPPNSSGSAPFTWPGARRFTLNRNRFGGVLTGDDNASDSAPADPRARSTRCGTTDLPADDRDRGAGGLAVAGRLAGTRAVGSAAPGAQR